MRRLKWAVLGIAAVAAAAAPRIRRDETRLLFTGDILLARQTAVEIARTGRSPWHSLATLFSGADWVMGNLEGAIGASDRCQVGANDECFAALDSSATLLARAGFDAVSTENNHAGDLGTEGRGVTARALRRGGVVGVSFANSPRFVRVRNLTVALIAVTTVRAADGTVQQIPSVELAQKLRLARSLADLVIVNVHWGTELQDWPNADQQAAATWLVEQGADVIVGHHPHVVQRADCVHGTPVFYSLGNHVFDQKYPETKLGAIADCHVSDRRLSCGSLSTRARPGSSYPVLVRNASSPGLCAHALPARVMMNDIELRAAPSDSDGVALEGWRDGRRLWRTRPVDVVSLEPGLGPERLLFALERHHSSMDGENALRPHVYAVTGRGLIARWRGTALAWPLIDARLDSSGDLCALHRGDSFVRPDPLTDSVRVMRYRWNGFGFSATQGSCSRQ